MSRKFVVSDTFWLN